MATMTQARRATDSGEPTNAELMSKLEAWIGEHRRDHLDLERRLSSHENAAVLRDSNITQLLASDRDLHREVDALHDFRVELMAYGKLVRFATGGSLIAAAAAVASLVLTITHLLETSHP